MRVFYACVLCVLEVFDQMPNGLGDNVLVMTVYGGVWRAPTRRKVMRQGGSWVCAACARAPGLGDGRARQGWMGCALTREHLELQGRSMASACAQGSDVPDLRHGMVAERGVGGLRDSE